MGIKQDVETSLADWPVTRIDGQPTEETISKLEMEITNLCASVPTTNGGGRHGHAGMIVESVAYTAFSYNGQPFTVPTNPGPYPMTVSADAATREKEVAEHKAEIAEFETYLGVESAARKKITSAIDSEWLESIRHPQMGFSHLTPKQLIDHLRTVSTDLDFWDVAILMKQLTTPWDINENVVTKFARDDRTEQLLTKAQIAPMPELRLALALDSFKATGEYEIALGDWDKKPTADKTFANFRPFILKEYAKRSKPNNSTAKSAGFGIANAAQVRALEELREEQQAETAWAVSEIARSLQKGNEDSMKALTDMVSKLLTKLDDNKSNSNQNSQGNRRRTRANPNLEGKAPCKHCNTVHAKPESECWELEANASSRPKGWTSRKTT